MICNATAAKKPETVESVVNKGCLAPLVHLLQSANEQLLLIALQAIVNILEAGATVATQDMQNR